MVKLAWAIIACLMASSGAMASNARPSVLFIGNSFTYAHGSPVRFYRADTVTDLNGEGIGGMPALFKSFTQQAGLEYDVFLETRGGAGLDYHLRNKLGVIGKREWDKVVMHGYSTLDYKKPRDPATLIAASKQMADFLRSRNPKVELYLMATWSRADETYPREGAWAGQPIEAMARDVRAAYDQAAKLAAVKMVIPVGEAWTRAMQAGVADPNPYDGIEPGKLDLWASDHYHASTYGYYLEALVVFGSLTSRDPRSLGEIECSAFELGFEPAQVKALQQVAFDQLAAAGIVTPDPLVLPKPADPVPCGRGSVPSGSSMGAAASGVARADSGKGPREHRIIPVKAMAGDVEILYGDPEVPGEPFVIRIRELPGGIVPPHSHPVDENITVVQGTWYFALGEEYDTRALHELKVGTYAFAPRGSTMFGYSPTGAIVQVHGVGPFRIHWHGGLHTLDDADAKSLFRFAKGDSVSFKGQTARIAEGYASGKIIQYEIEASGGERFMASEDELR